MSETEICLAQAYLQAAGQDPVGALIRSVRDLARIGSALASADEAVNELAERVAPAAHLELQD